jgi:hypothetical protein
VTGPQGAFDPRRWQSGDFNVRPAIGLEDYSYSGIFFTNVPEELSTFWCLLASGAVLLTVVAVDRRFLSSSAVASGLVSTRTSYKSAELSRSLQIDDEVRLELDKSR